VSLFLVVSLCSFSGFSSTSMKNSERTFVGFDFGTSGARLSIIQRPQQEELYSDSIAWTTDRPYDDASAWLQALDTLLQRCSQQQPHLLQRVGSICVSGTSASCLLVSIRSNRETISRPPRMYDYNVISTKPENTTHLISARRILHLLDTYSPTKHTSRSPTGSLAKLLCWNEERPLLPFNQERLLHQADYVARSLLDDIDSYTTSDWHNCLKLGYDVQSLQWPQWLLSCLDEAEIPRDVLPSRVVSPGEVIGPISSHVAVKYGIPKDATVVGGTTDSNAAFFAAVQSLKPPFGTAVTSLGSTLAIKQLSRDFVEDADRGVYSHRFPLLGISKEEKPAWLIGGASNVGCGILRHLGFSNSELRELSEEIDPTNNSPLDYYPLKTPGERFPICDENLQPILEPIPPSRKDYIHAILQGITKVEGLGYQVLAELGASPMYPSVIWTCGGGAENDVWRKMRERILTESFGQPVQVQKSANTEASYGAAILAASSYDE